MVCVSPLAGQSADSSSVSLGDVAKKAKTNTGAKAKKVFTDDDVPARKNPIPAVALQGDDNSDLVLNAVREYRKSHNVDETQRVVHDWFDEHDEILATAAEDNAQISQHGQYRSEQNEANEDGDQDYRKVRQRMAEQRRSQRVDARRNRDNWQMIMRIQQTMQKVRTELQMNRIPCEWLKIRQGNGLNSY